MPNTPVRSLRIPDDVWNTWKYLADSRGLTVTDMLKTAVTVWTDGGTRKPKKPSKRTRKPKHPTENGPARTEAAVRPVNACLSCGGVVLCLDSRWKCRLCGDGGRL